MMKVLFLTNVPSPYRVSFFNELGKHCNLTVLFEKRISDERDDSWKSFIFENFSGIFLKGKSVSTDTAFCPAAAKYVLNKSSYDIIICADLSSPTGMFAIQLMKMRKIKYYIEADGGTAKDGKGIKEKVKKHFISGAEGYFSTSETCDCYFKTYGAQPERLIRYPFTSLYENDILPQIPAKTEKYRLRERLHITEEKIILSVGRFSYLNGYGKGYDVLLKAAGRLSRDIGWYIVGGEPTEEFKKMTSDAGLDNVHYVDFKQKEELKEYYRAADLFVLMTVGDVWGLVINEAMACGLPVITTDKCVAGVELVEEGKNGYIVSVGDDSALADRIERIFNDPETALEMGKRSLEIIQSYTIENMAKTHIEAFERMKNEKENTAND